jgi:hypothetical protein
MEQNPYWEANSRSASQEIPSIYGIWRLITVLIRARHWTLFWASWIQASHSHLISLGSVLSSFHLRICLPSGPFSSGFRTEVLYTYVSHACYYCRLMCLCSYYPAQPQNLRSSFRTWFVVCFAVPVETSVQWVKRKEGRCHCCHRYCCNLWGRCGK